MLRQIAARIIKFTVLFVIFFASCTGTMTFYENSPKWSLEKVNLEKDKTFFIAYMLNESDDVKVTMHRSIPSIDKATAIRFHLPREHMTYNIWGEGEGYSKITTVNEENGNQLIQIVVMGPIVPWFSLSEYRVIHNKIYPLRHAVSNNWILLGLLFSPILVAFLNKPIGRRINRYLGVESKQS